MKDLICIMCPKGCHLKVDEEHGYTVTGNRCPRGAQQKRLPPAGKDGRPDPQVYDGGGHAAFGQSGGHGAGACRRCGGRQYLPHRGALCGHQNGRRISVFPWPACSGKRAVLIDRHRRVPCKFPKLKTLSFFGKIGTEAGVPLVAAGG